MMHMRPLLGRHIWTPALNGPRPEPSEGCNPSSSTPKAHQVRGQECWDYPRPAPALAQQTRPTGTREADTGFGGERLKQ